MLNHNSTDIGSIPAGIFQGTEYFVESGTRWAMHNGRLMRYNQLPDHIQDKLESAFESDIRSQIALKKAGITGREAFYFWLDCRYGAYDNTPDYKDGKLQEAEYNSSCKKINCPMRGIVCKNPAGLNNQEVDTILCIQRGFTITEIADKLCKSAECIKSRIKNIKEKLEAKNSANAAVKALKRGIL